MVYTLVQSFLPLELFYFRRRYSPLAFVYGKMKEKKERKERKAKKKGRISLERIIVSPMPIALTRLRCARYFDEEFFFRSSRCEALTCRSRKERNRVCTVRREHVLRCFEKIMPRAER